MLFLASLLGENPQHWARYYPKHRVNVPGCPTGHSSGDIPPLSDLTDGCPWVLSSPGNGRAQGKFLHAKEGWRFDRLGCEEHPPAPGTGSRGNTGPARLPLSCPRRCRARSSNCPTRARVARAEGSHGGGSREKFGEGERGRLRSPGKRGERESGDGEDMGRGESDRSVRPGTRSPGRGREGKGEGEG